jgi:hypothetical protein
VRGLLTMSVSCGRYPEIVLRPSPVVEVIDYPHGTRLW